MELSTIINKEDKKDDKYQKLSKSEIKLANTSIYIISCFNKYLWDEKYFVLKSKNNKVISIDNISKKELLYDKEFYSIIHKINLRSKDLDILYLHLFSEDSQKTLYLDPIRFNLDTEILLFVDIKICYNSMNQLIKIYGEKNYERKLKNFEKFRIYYDYLTQENIGKVQNLKNNLVMEFLVACKEDDNIIYSDIIKAFNLSFGKKIIPYFLEKYVLLDIEFDDIKDKSFDEILNIYLENKKSFLEQNKKHYQKKQKKDEDKYDKALENFIIIYILLIQKGKNLSNKQLMNAKSTLLKLINNKKYLIKRISFIFNHFSSIAKVFQSSEKLSECLKITYDSQEDLINLNYEQFKSFYQELINEQEQNKKYILDFSDIFIGLTDMQNDTELLIDIKILYNKEMKKFPNPTFEKKINELIHNMGMQKISRGGFDNFFLILFLKNDCIGINKNYEVLSYFKIELMNDKFFEKFNSDEIYLLFKDNYQKYLSKFFDKIKDIKYFGLFFKLLPSSEYKESTVNFVIEWIKQNINTFDNDKCKNFKEELFIFFNIMLNKKLNNQMIDLIKFIKENIRAYSSEIFIYLLNQEKTNFNQEIIKILITNILFEYENIDDELNLNNVNIFLEKININKQYLKTFLSKIEKFSLEKDDLFTENNRFQLFEIILNNNKIKLNIESLMHSVYWQNAKNVCKSLVDDLDKLNINYVQILHCFKLIGEEKLKKRLNSIYRCQNIPGHEYKSIQTFEAIKIILEDTKEKINKIEKMKNYNIFICKQSQNVILINKELSDYNRNIFNSKLNYLNSKDNQKNFSKLINEKYFSQVVETIEKLRNSKVFLRIFNYIKNKERDYISEISIKEFNKLKYIFGKNEQDIDKQLKSIDNVKYIIEVGRNDINQLVPEINWMINYFNINYFTHENYLIRKLEVYIQNQSLFLILSGILDFLDIYNDVFKPEDEEIKSFINYISNSQQLLKMKDIITLEQFDKINVYIEEKFQVSEYKIELFNKFFIEVNKNPNCIKFIKYRKVEQMQHIKEFLLENEQSQLKEEDINDFIKVIQFFEEQTSNLLNKNLSFYSLINNIIIAISNSPHLNKSLFHYMKMYNHIELLLNKYLRGSDEVIKKLQFILNDSTFIIKVKNTKESSNKKYFFSGIYKNFLFKEEEEDNNNSPNISNFPVIFLSDLETIIQKLFMTKIPDFYQILFDELIHLYENIKQIINILDELYINGYHSNFEIKIELNDSNIKSYLNNREKKIDDILIYLYNLNVTITKKLNIFYEEKEYIRCFYPRQLISIYYNIINEKKEENSIDNKILLNINFNNEIQKLKPIIKKEDFIINRNKDIDDYCEVLEKVNNYISEQLNFNKKKLEQIYEINKIKFDEKPLHSGNTSNKIKGKTKKYVGIFFRMPKMSNINNQELECLYIYQYMTYNLPINICFLYCSKNTTYEELKYFLIRSFLCQYYVLFCIINIELLSNTLRKQFTFLLKTYKTKFRRRMKSCLLLMFKDEELHSIILKMKNIETLPEHLFAERDIFFDKNYAVTLYTSRYCGYGKSYLIKSQKKEKIDYIYFPIGGKFNLINLKKRFDSLPDISDTSKKFLIHFDITQTKEIEFLNEFFFKLIILRKYDIYTTKHFGKNIEIVIEIPNDFTDYIKEIKIFKNLTKNNIFKVAQMYKSDDLINVGKFLYIYENKGLFDSKKNFQEILSKLKFSEEKCENIIMKYIQNNNLTNPNFYQLNIFIKILSGEFNKLNNLFTNFSEYFYNVDNFQLFVSSLIKNTKLLIVSPYESLIKNQEINQQILEEGEENKEIKMNKKLEINIDSISFDNINPSLIVFNEDGISFQIICSCSKNDNEFKKLEKLLYNLEENYDGLKNFRELKNDEIFEKLLQFLNVSEYFKSPKIKNRILGSYVYTPDNFIKVVLIIMRIRMKIPVILMGETGCGKTKLIEMAYQLINKGDNKLQKMNIHAGIQDEDIIKFMKALNDIIVLEDEKIYKEKIAEFEKLPKEIKNKYLKTNSKENIYLGYKKEIEQRKIWIFFDEINTCDSMGLLTEMMCKNSMNGIPLDNRYIFIAACNPYRVSKKENFLLNVLYKKNHKKKSLVYTVNPLPMSLMNFVFNFGSLKPNDEKSYIKSMVERTINKYFKDNNKKTIKEKEKLIDAETECVEICQKFLKKNNDVSIVSLREVNRFNIFLDFFIKYLLERKTQKGPLNHIINKEEIIQFYASKTEIDIFYYALNLSLFICYFLRLPDKESREKLSSELNQKKYFLDNNFLKIPEMEMNYLVKNFIIPEGIAKNKQLKENLFLLFFCIINKIPLIICGKPGRSKTLSFKILSDSMKGSLSPTNFCQKYPELMPLKIQGSLNTTSEEILKIFKRGRANQEENPNKLWVVFMDEMGLAEISENNPLKVIHAELEQEINKISFVGISNWFIDASKMNRVIYNVVQDPDEEDLIETGKEIAKSYEINGDNICLQYENVIIKLSMAYYKFYSKKKNNNDDNQYFHGSRDFYSLIKSVIKDIIKYEKKLNESSDDKNQLLNEICVNQIMRNFGGLEDSINEFKNYFFNNYEKTIYLNLLYFKYDVMKCLKENINDENSRYLLLINENNLSQEILNYIIEDICQDKNNEKGKGNKINIKYFFGSKFKADKNNISYTNDILKKIKYEMSTENIIILKDLDSVYPALYELFNQSYIYLDGKKFVRLGESESLSLVNDKFKVIVIVDKDQIENQEPPFLNRFEKHIINYTNLLNNDLLEISNEIYSALNKINNYIKKYAQNESQFSIFYSQSSIISKLGKFTEFINEEEIKGLVYIGSIKLKNENKSNKNDYKNSIIKFVLSKIVPYFSEELMILITKYGWKNEFDFYYQNIYEIFSEQYNFNLKTHLETLENDVSIIYTYSPIIEEYKQLFNIINNKKLGIDFSINAMKEISISEINSQSQIEKEIYDFIRNDLKVDLSTKIKKNLLLIKFREEELYKLNNITYLLNDYKNTLAENKIEVTKKVVIFIIYLKKDEKIRNNSISLISNYPQKLIQNLNGQHPNFPQILISSNEEIIKKELIDMNYIIINNINDIFRYFTFDIINYFEEERKCPFTYKLLQDSIKSKSFLNILIECLLQLIKNQEEDFVIKVFREEICYKNGLLNTEFMNDLFEHLNEIFFINFRKIIIILEKEHIIETAIFNEKIYQHKVIKKYMDNYILGINNDNNKNFKWNDKNLNQKQKLSILYGRKLPFLENIFNSIFLFITKNISNQFLEEDTYFFYQKIPDDLIHGKQEKYLKSLQNLNNKLNLEIKKYSIIFDILNSNSKELIFDFFEDLLFCFIKKNSLLKKDYIKLSKLLDLMIQIRMKTRINNKLGMDDIDKNLDCSSFFDLIENEIEEQNKNKINEEEEEIMIQSDNQNIYINHFLSIIIFLQSYSKEIYLILNIYYFLLSYFPKIYEKILIMIKNKEISMEKHDNNNRNKDYVNVNKASFFYIIEPICKIINQNICNILAGENNNNEVQNEKYLKLVQSFNYNLLKLEKKFMFYSNEIFHLDILMKIITKIKMIVKEPKQLYNVIILFDDFNKNIEEKQKQIINIYHILMQYLEERPDEFGKIKNEIILNAYNSEKDDKIRNEIIKSILIDLEFQHNEKQLEYSYPILNKIFNFYSIQLLNSEQNLFKSFEKRNIIKESISSAIIRKETIINEILLYRFEIIFDDYFNKIKNNYLKDINLKKYLNDAINVYYEKNNLNLNLENICVLFSIGYIKCYLNYLAEILIDRDKFLQFIDRREIFQILFDSNCKKKNCVMYYFMKILSKKYKTWEDFLKFYENNNINEFNIYFKSINLNEENAFFCSPFLLLDINKENEIDYTRLLFKNELKSENLILFKRLFLEGKNYEYLYTFLSNIKIFYYSCKNGSDKKAELLNLNKDIIKYINENGIIQDKDVLEFFNSFFDENKFESIKEKIGFDKNKINYEDTSELLKKKITILYYSLRFVFSAIIKLGKIKNKEKIFYSNLISKNISFSALDKTYIPGNFINTSLKIESFYEIKPFLVQDPLKYGAYMCSCGHYYTVGGCTFPTRKYKCPKCGYDIGGENHKLVRRSGHIRIFFDEFTRKELLKKSYVDKDIPNKLLSDLEIEIEDEKKKLNKGFKSIDKNIFLRKDEKVRDMNDITYRFLNFILYSFIFYGYINGTIDENHINKYLIGKMSIFEIMETNWDIMQKILEKLSVETFINIIFDIIIQKIENISILDTEEKTINFEKEINEIVLNMINDENYIKKYKQKNDDILKTNPESSKLIIQEHFPYNKYSETEYPNLKYFYISELPSKKHFLNKFNSRESNKEKYPIINSILNDKDFLDKLELMKHLPKINELLNYMINFVSFRYSREEAKSILINEEKEKFDDDKIILIKEFIPIYKQFRSIIKQQGCHDFGKLYLEMNYDTLTLNDLCVDSKEEGYGLVLYAIYEEMISWQNKFINTIINTEKNQIKIYKELFDIKILIQECEEEQILSLPKFDEYINNKDEDSFNLLKTVLDNSSRKENKVIYNFEEIENTLAEYILPKIKSFKTEIKQVVYQYECYLGERNSIVIDFIEKYQQRELNDNELKGLINCLLDNEKNNKFDMKNILFSFFIIIDIILEESPDINTTLYKIISEHKSNYCSDKIKDFFNSIKENIKGNTDKYFTINCLINLMEILEIFCWKNIRNNMDKRYFEEINEEIKIKLDKNLNNKNNTINKIDLCSAIRKFISRNLSGKSDGNIGKDKKLEQYLINQELWPQNYNDVEDDINLIFDGLNIKVSQAVKLYDHLGGDDIKLKEIINKYKNNEKKINYIEENHIEEEEKNEKESNESDDELNKENESDESIKDDEKSDDDDGDEDDDYDNRIRY